jgi:uracil-DNA glycosylase
MTWQSIQESIRICTKCDRLQGSLLAHFNRNWPDIPPPFPRAILFISEAPPQDGGFWTIQPPTAKQDDLREKLLTLLKLSRAGPDRGLTSFREAGYFLLQCLPRPLKISIGGVKTDDLKMLLKHQAETHLREQTAFFSPSAVLALGKPASVAVSLLFPNSSFARSFETGDFSSVRGKMFLEQGPTLLSATYLPSGNGRFRKQFWETDIPMFVHQARSLT